MHLSLNATARKKLRRGSILAATCAALTAIFAFNAPTARAYEMKLGEVDVSVDTTVTVGVQLRASGRDCTNINPANGGCTFNGGQTASINADNGNLNFDQWDFTSATVKATHDIQATYQNFGVFTRVKYFYDYVYAENDLRFRNLLGDAKEQLDYGIDVLDAFVYGNFAVGNVPVTLRVGNQVVNWGESLFQQGGVNAFQAIDVTAIRTPGSELKEALTPMPMVFASATLGDSSVEGFWQWDWEKTEIDPSGSFFSTLDIAGLGPNPALFTAPDDLATSPVQLAVESDEVDEDSAEFGFAFRHYAQEVNGGTEFGLYYTHYTSRLPFLGYRSGSVDATAACSAVTGGGACASAADVNNAIGFASGFNTVRWVYPDSINTVGVSAATTIGDHAFAIESSFTPDMPLQTESNQQLASQLDGGGFSDLVAGVPGYVSSDLTAVGANGATAAVTESDALQGQFSTISTFTRSNEVVDMLGADLGVLLVNAGFMYVPDAGNLFLNHGGTEIGVPDPVAAAVLTANGQTNVQYATSFSTGYRVVFITTYNNPFDIPITLTPSIGFRHDTSGFAPGPIGPGFVKGVKQVSIGVGASYLNAWNASLSYTNGFGGGIHNGTADRDFVSASLSYSF